MAGPVIGPDLMNTKIMVAAIFIIVIGTALITREVFPRKVPMVIRIPEPVVIDLSDSTRADYERLIAAHEQMGRLQGDRIADLVNRPAVVTAETTFVDRPVGVACEADSFAPRWRVRDLTVGRNMDERTILRSELIAADSGSIVITPQMEQHVTLGPLVGVFPKEDGTGIRLEFDDWPEDTSCGLFCKLGHYATGAGIGAGAAMLACSIGS